MQTQPNNGTAGVLILVVVVALHLTIIAFLVQRIAPPAPVSISTPRVMTAMLVPTPVVPMQTQSEPEPPPRPVEHKPDVATPEIQKTEVKPTPLPVAETPEPAVTKQPEPTPPVQQNSVEPVTSAPIASPPQANPPSTTPAAQVAPPAEQRIVEHVDAQPLPSPSPSEPEPPVIAPVSYAAHLSNPAPVYPRQSQRRREQGTVMLEVLILADGSVADVRVKESSGYARLDKAALEAVAQWRYVPASQGDKTIDYWHMQPVVFSLR